MLYLLRICLVMSYGLCDNGIDIPYPTRLDCLTAFDRVMNEAPRPPARVYCVSRTRTIII